MHIKSRLDSAIKALREDNLEIKEIRQLSGGINSVVYQLESRTKKNYALKIYPNNRLKDARIRQKRESEFLNYLELSHLHNTPRLIVKNEEQHWSLLSWVPGNNIKEITIGDIYSIVNFICSINSPNLIDERKKLSHASEACRSIDNFCSNISGRLNSLTKLKPKSKTEQTTLHWIDNELKPFANRVFNCIMAKKHMHYWNDTNLCQVASPSDVGIHNSLKYKGNLYFLDYEYAGLDDLSKLVNDWILQPNCPLDERLENLLISELSKNRLLFGEKWVERYLDIKEMIFIKWIIIMLNPLKRGDFTKANLSRIFFYILNEGGDCFRVPQIY